MHKLTKGDNIFVMTINQLRIFIKVAEKLNFTDAAEELFMTQPAVSRAISSLESELGVSLFYRDKKRGIHLTPIGTATVQEFRKVIQLVNKVEEFADEEKGLKSGKIRIGSFVAASSYFLPQVISYIKSRYPDIKFELKEGTSDQVKKWIDDYQIDVGIVASPTTDYEHFVLLKDKMVVVLPPNHRLTEKEIVTIEELGNEELILCKGGHEAAVNEAFANEHMNLNDGITVQSGETLVKMVNNGLGAGIISEFTLATVPHTLPLKTISPAIKRDICLITSSFDDLSISVKYFVDILKKFTEEQRDEEITSSLKV
ncbi:hypothetical protein AM592_19795 [Bacillus gobiensis]|uniref:HTH lysR-type domain-containing protein n=2 Tax=Bacillus TaxID=1386 RepID=A0A0M3RB58_9BACI|nr:hypothetical protein AM592_19795 [Bacillus gobiensis]